MTESTSESIGSAPSVVGASERGPVSHTVLARTFELILRHPGINRAALAKSLGVKAATMTRAVGALSEQGLVIESVGRAGSHGAEEKRRIGRPVTQLQASPDIAIAAVALRDTEGVKHPGLARVKLAGVIAGVEGRDSEKTTGQLHVSADLPPDERARAVARDLKNFIEKDMQAPARLAVVSISMGGELRDGQVLGSCNIAWQHGGPVALAQRLREEMPQAEVVIVENDADAAAEHLRWSAHGPAVAPAPVASDDFVAVLVTEDGVGAGLYLNGRRYTGGVGGAGEIGHLPFRRTTEPRSAGHGRQVRCRCSKIDCVETYAAPNSMLERLNEDKTLLEAASSMAQAPLKVFREGGEALGGAVASVITVLAPSEVVILAQQDLACYAPVDGSFTAPTSKTTAGGAYWSAFGRVVQEICPHARTRIHVVPLEEDLDVFLVDTSVSVALDQLVQRLQTRGPWSEPS